MPELLSPAGSFDALKAAVCAGADAVYLGATAFSARASAANFDEESLPRAVRYAHAAGVKVLVTVNTLILPGEMEDAVSLVLRLRDAGADGLIIQDMGLAAELVRRLGPTVPMNASTQATVHNLAGIQEMARRGFRRVVLARELSLDTLKGLCAESPIELETFAHGALCVSCSGACLMSSFIGSRSGNRGRCAQPCRLPYTLNRSGRPEAEGTLLSPKDLMTLPFLAELCKAGIASLKIEGRLKRPEYVTLTTRAYRRALDAIAEVGHFEPTPDDIDRLMRVFNRGGFTKAYFFGTDDAALMNHVQSNHTGVEVGKVLNARAGRVRLSEPLHTGDGLQLRPGGEGISWNAPLLPAGLQHMNLPRTAADGASLFKTTDAVLMAEAVTDGEPPRRSMTGAVRIIPGECPVLTLKADGCEVTVTGDEAVQEAKNRALSAEDVRRSLEKTDTYPWTLTDLSVETAGAFLPVSKMNALRRDALERLLEAVLQSRLPLWSREKPAPAAAGKSASFAPAETKLSARVVTVEQAAAAFDAGAARVFLAPGDFNALPDLASLQKYRADGKTLGLALPLWLPEEDLAFVKKALAPLRGAVDALLVPNLGAALALADDGWPVEGDLSLNLGNAFSVGSMADTPLRHVTLSAELTASQAREAAAGREDFCDLPVYGRAPLMHLVHCPYRAAKKLPGTGEGCRACGEAPLSLTDRMGASFPLRHIRLARCQQMLYNSVPMDAAHMGGKLPRVGGWRMDFLEETPEEVKTVVRRFADALAGLSQPVTDAPHTTGHLARGVE